MIISVPKESFAGEKRVALTPDVAPRIAKLGYVLRIERGAGAAAGFADADYEQAGVAPTDAVAIWRDTDIIMKVRPVSAEEADKIGRGRRIMHAYCKRQRHRV